jgi:hypothetical protein
MSALPDGVEDACSKLGSMVDLLAHMAWAHEAGEEDRMAGTYWSLHNLAAGIYGDLLAGIERGLKHDPPEAEEGDPD